MNRQIDLRKKQDAFSKVKISNKRAKSTLKANTEMGMYNTQVNYFSKVNEF